VRGRASRPEIALSSQPTLPQDEILARILFGKSASNLSSLEAAQLAVAAAELSAGGGGPGLLDRLRSFVGVDVLRVGSAETAGTGADGDAEGGTTPTVEAGKYVTDDVFVGVEQGATADSSKVTVEVEVTDNIAVESDVGATGSGNLGIKFQWDY
jgi:translocation and assembly module TamB